MKTDIHLWSYLAHVFLEWKIFQTKVVEKIKIHVLCSTTFFFWNLAICEIMWGNFVELGQVTWQYGACVLHTGYPRLQTHSEYIILIAFSLQHWLRERVWPLRYTHVVSLNPLAYTNACQAFWAIDVFSFNSSLLSVDGMTCLIPFKSLRNDLSNGISYVEIVSIFRLYIDLQTYDSRL